jgi:hypothetical protein
MKKLTNTGMLSQQQNEAAANLSSTPHQPQLASRITHAKRPTFAIQGKIIDLKST